ncbi:MAG: PLP-dependent aminotransferase family protein [Clostridia bacterium]|nr:PLP-dependent aminotransferase family protein [Clostridia bacterium]
MKNMFADRVQSLKGSAIREMFKLLAQPDMISFAGGAPAPELFPGELLGEISQKILKENAKVALQYGITEGYVPLREYTRARMEKKGNIHDHDELIITSGGQQALDLTFKSLLNEGDTVVLESPSFIGGMNSLRSYNAKLHGIEIEEDGMNIDLLEEYLKDNKIKLVYTISTFQNPSGITMSAEKRKRLLDLASKHDFYILEDNPYGELRFTGEDVPTIKSFDTEGRVIYAGSYSKTISPGLRLGWAIARKDIMEKMIICKQVSDVHTCVLPQMMAAEFFAGFDFDAHIEKSKVLYRERARAMMDAMDTYFPKECTHTVPEGGIFLWCTLPEGYDSDALLKQAVAEKVAFVAGSTCMPVPEEGARYMRFNYSLTAPDKIKEGIIRLGEVIRNAR